MISYYKNELKGMIVFMEKINNMIIYQLALRSFTPEGTLNSAKLLLSHIASLGVDIVYVCPFFTAENDSDRMTWSVRQTDSKTENPKNPYKIADYFNVDEEYGTNEDLKEFVKEAHECGLKILFDLVYLHCGKRAVFVDDHPDFVVRNEDGTILVPDRWPFARLNFESKELREYLYSNMRMFMEEYGADGFRCDVGDDVPLDFWDDSFKRLKKDFPEMITLNEGIKPEYIESVFDMGYNFAWNLLMVDIFAKGESASKLKARYSEEMEIYGENISKLIRTIDTHDTASDIGLDRNEITMTSKGVEAALVITNTFDGVPFLWNGYEVCDNAENNMFSNRFFGRRSWMNWSRAFTPEGVRRAEFIKNIHNLKHTNDALINGKIEWLDNDAPDDVISYVKKSDNQEILILVNSKKKTVKVNNGLKFKNVLMKSGADISDCINFEPYGYIIAEI